MSNIHSAPGAGSGYMPFPADLVSPSAGTQVNNCDLDLGSFINGTSSGSQGDLTHPGASTAGTDNSGPGTDTSDPADSSGDRSPGSDGSTRNAGSEASDGTHRTPASGAQPNPYAPAQPYPNTTINGDGTVYQQAMYTQQVQPPYQLSATNGQTMHQPSNMSAPVPYQPHTTSYGSYTTLQGSGHFDSTGPAFNVPQFSYCYHNGSSQLPPATQAPAVDYTAYGLPGGTWTGQTANPHHNGIAGIPDFSAPPMGGTSSYVPQASMYSGASRHPSIHLFRQWHYASTASASSPGADRRPLAMAYACQARA